MHLRTWAMLQNTTALGPSNSIFPVNYSSLVVCYPKLPLSWRLLFFHLRTMSIPMRHMRFNIDDLDLRLRTQQVLHGVTDDCA